MMFIFRGYLIFVGVLLIGSISIAYILENVMGVTKVVVLYNVTAWAIASIALLLWLVQEE